jgi:hypothetical protein
LATPLNQDDVARLGASLLRETVGESFAGDVFLAGGAFRTLLTGALPRDLDLWAPDADTRTRLVDWLIQRGAVHERDHPPFQTCFGLGRHRVDVPYAVGTPTLGDRLATFDLGLAAVGVTWRRGRVVEAVVDPCAVRSVEERAVLLLRPLRNVSYLLNTVERARRYARELGFDWPQAEEEHLWATFASLPCERREKVLSNYAWADGRDPQIVAHARGLMEDR